MPIVTTRSIVLQTYPYSDTSKILRLMTLEHGPRSAIARGALRPKSRFGGLIEPFAEGFATLYLKEGRELLTLSDFDLLRERQRLGDDLARFAGASVLAEMVMRLAPEHRDERLFEALRRGLDELLDASRGVAEATALRAIWRLVAVLGFAPDLSRCVLCGRPIELGPGVRFDFAAGGLRCEEHPPEGVRIGAAELRAMRRLASRSPELPEVGPEQRELLADFIRYHLSEGVRIRALDFFRHGSGRGAR